LLCFVENHDVKQISKVVWSLCHVGWLYDILERCIVSRATDRVTRSVMSVYSYEAAGSWTQHLGAMSVIDSFIIIYYEIEKKRDFVNHSRSASIFFLCIHISIFFFSSVTEIFQWTFVSVITLMSSVIDTIGLFFVVCLHLHWSVAFILVAVCGCRLLPYHMSYSSSLEVTELRNFRAEIQSLFVNKGFICDGYKFQLLLSVNKARYGTSFIHSPYHILHDYSLLLASRYILSLL